MDDPVTQLDERFSEPAAHATSWTAAREVLAAAQLSWILTVRADGTFTHTRHLPSQRAR